MHPNRRDKEEAGKKLLQKYNTGSISVMFDNDRIGYMPPAVEFIFLPYCAINLKAAATENIIFSTNGNSSDS